MRPQQGKDQSGLTVKQRHAAHKRLRTDSFRDEGAKGTTGGSLEALAQHRPKLPQQLGPRCAGINRAKKPCQCPAIQGAKHCRHHGGYLEAPRSSAARRWYRRDGHASYLADKAERALRKQTDDATQEENKTVREHMPHRAAGGRLGKLQLLFTGLQALRAQRDGTDPMAWGKFVRLAKRSNVGTLEKKIGPR